MVRFTVLASGSKGNSAVVSGGITRRRQMTYAQWIEQCRQQPAERQAESTAEAEACECDDADADGAVKTAPANGANGTAKATAPEAEKPDPAWLPSVEYFQAGRP